MKTKIFIDASGSLNNSSANYLSARGNAGESGTRTLFDEFWEKFPEAEFYVVGNETIMVTPATIASALADKSVSGRFNFKAILDRLTQDGMPDKVIVVTDANHRSDDLIVPLRYQREAWSFYVVGDQTQPELSRTLRLQGFDVYALVASKTYTWDLQ
ncbi:MAG: hypothetical protein JSS66_05870 [Armatimonadetes bacterium]|nr:hypothetical protein [Armatimonadota bacterium]